MTSVPPRRRRAVSPAGPTDRPAALLLARYHHLEEIDPREPRPVPPVQVARVVEAVEHHHRPEARARRGQGVDAQPHPVDRAQPGVGHQEQGVGPEPPGQVDGVTVGRLGRADAAGRLHHPHLGPVGPVELLHQVVDRELRPAQGLGGHRRRHGRGVPAVERADPLGRLPARPAEHGGIGGRRVVTGIERLGRLAGGHRHARGPEVLEQPGGHPGLADLGAGADDQDHFVRSRRRLSRHRPPRSPEHEGRGPPRRPPAGPPARPRGPPRA